MLISISLTPAPLHSSLAGAEEEEETQEAS